MTSWEQHVREASRALPLRVREVVASEVNLVLSGADWSLMVMCPMRFRTPEKVLGWDRSLEDEVWELIGRDLESIRLADDEPVFDFGGGYCIEVFADTDWDPWVLRLPTFVLVGQIPPLPKPRPASG